MMPAETETDLLARFEQSLADRSQELRAMKIPPSPFFVMVVTATMGDVLFAAGAACAAFIGQGG